MDEAKDYKAYLKALKEMTKKKSSLPSSKKYKKVLGTFPTIKKLSEGGMCRGMGAAVKGGNFKGVM